MRIALAAFLFVLAVTYACGSSNSPGEEAGLGDPNVRAKLRTLALQASATAGVASPRTMVAVASPDHQAAEQIVSGDIVNDHAPVYVVAMTGGPFTSIRGNPFGGPSSQGDVLTLTVDARTYDVTDVGITSVQPDLTQIDPDVVDLLE
jgi:hypothetical protein